ncbi:hypothetical protein D3C81_1965660 [compost metagenome]
MFRQTLFEIAFAIRFREAVDATKEGYGFDGFIRAFARFYTGLRPVRYENTIAVTVDFRVLIHHDISTDDRRTVGTRYHGHTAPRFYA